jgi:cytochrome c2
MRIPTILIAIFLTALPAQASTLEIVTPGKSLKFSLNELRQKLKLHEIKLEDPVYKREKHFDGFLLGEVLGLAGINLDESKADEIVFTAKDGYSPNTSFAKLREHRAYLVFQEHGTREKFGKIEQGKSLVSPAPYYVVWAEGKKLAEEVPWPYQLVRIEIVDFAAKFPRLYPQNAQAESPAAKGFQIFKNQCLRCHSINLQGGDLGPELNVPKNITEYWDRKVLRQFIRNPLEFRLKSKMPPFAFLKEGEIDHLLEYLEHMKNYK